MVTAARSSPACQRRQDEVLPLLEELRKFDFFRPNNKDPQRSITKEAILKLIADPKWAEPGTTPNWDAPNNQLSGIALTARLGDEETRKIPIRIDGDGNIIEKAPFRTVARKRGLPSSPNPRTYYYYD